MADFLANLWTSIFTPGTTPTLLTATNATFGTLQLLLLALLVATYSVHFLVLSVLCGGLWWAINWFAAELSVAQERQKEQEEERKGKSDVGKSSASDADDTETETGDTIIGQEGTVRRKRESKAEPAVPGTTDRGVGERGLSSSADVREGEAGSGGSMVGLVPVLDEALRRRSESEHKSGVSTDSEWEKVEGENS